MNHTEALVNLTWMGRNADLAQPVFYLATDAEIRAWVTEAVRFGGVSGLPADGPVDLRDFVVDRFPASETIPYNRIFVRPKTPFGAA